MRSLQATAILRHSFKIAVAKATAHPVTRDYCTKGAIRDCDDVPIPIGIGTRNEVTSNPLAQKENIPNLPTWENSGCQKQLFQIKGSLD
jgi:hypothetical protein